MIVEKMNSKNIITEVDDENVECEKPKKEKKTKKKTVKKTEEE
jgi:hypothetical protein